MIGNPPYTTPEALSDLERTFFEAAKKSAYRSWWIMNKTLVDCPDCVDTSDLKDEKTDERLRHEPDCPLGSLIDAYWEMVGAAQGGGSVNEPRWRQFNEGFTEASGILRPHQSTHLILPFVPYTRWQRLLHRVGVHRWHRHQDLTPLLDFLRDTT